MLDAMYRDRDADRIAGDPTDPALRPVAQLAAQVCGVALAIVSVDGDDDGAATSLADPLVAAERGYRFFAAEPLLSTSGAPLGTLCLLGQEHHVLTEDQLATLALVATVASAQIELRDRARTAQQTADQLEDGLMSNRTIGKAMGLVMAQYRIDEDQAFAKLRDHSRDLNMKVRSLAEQIVAHHNRGCAARD